MVVQRRRFVATRAGALREVLAARDGGEGVRERDRSLALLTDSGLRGEEAVITRRAKKKTEGSANSEAHRPSRMASATANDKSPSLSCANNTHEFWLWFLLLIGAR